MEPDSMVQPELGVHPRLASLMRLGHQIELGPTQAKERRWGLTLAVPLGELGFEQCFRSDTTRMPHHLDLKERRGCRS
jgi:hypothetical protein